MLGCSLIAGGNVHAQNPPPPPDRQQTIQSLYEETFRASQQAQDARIKAKGEFDEKIKPLRQQVAAKGEAIMHALGAQPTASADDAARKFEARNRFADFMNTRNTLLKAFNVPAIPLPSAPPSPALPPSTLLQRLEGDQETTEGLPVDVQKYLAQSPFIAELSNPDLTSEERVYLQVALWHQISLDFTALDHTSQPPNSPPISYSPFEKQGPVRSSRVLALTHLASFEAVNAVSPRYYSYDGIASRLATHPNVPATINDSTVSSARAIAEANFKVLANQYPTKLSFLVQIMAVVVPSITDTPDKLAAGQALGDAVADEILADRATDKSAVLDPSSDAFAKLPASQWHPDPLNPGGATQVAYGALWSLVTPFVIARADQFRLSAPPDVHSEAYKEAYEDVRIKGGDFYANPALAPVGLRASTDTNRTGWDRTKPDFEAANTETFKGKFWAYDGTPYLCAPPRLYNMIASSLAYRERKITDSVDYARYLALINLALADAGIAAWEEKYYWLYPRPVTGIRNATNLNLPFTNAKDTVWTPLGAQVTNTMTQNFTPNFPSYPSGHAVFGGAVFQVLRRINDVTGRHDPEHAPAPGNDDTPPTVFQFLSDEYDGLNVDPGTGLVRPRRQQDFTSLAQAEWENGRSRVYLGIHWQFDAVAGIHEGNQVGDYVFDHALQPLNAAPPANTPAPTP